MPGIADKNPARRGLCRAPGDQRAAAGWRGRHHQARDGAAADGAAQAGLRARLLLQVHDELLFEAPEAEVAALAELARRVMESAAVLSVPLVVETGSGRTWAEAH